MKATSPLSPATTSEQRVLAMRRDLVRRLVELSPDFFQQDLCGGNHLPADKPPVATIIPFPCEYDAQTG